MVGFFSILVVDMTTTTTAAATGDSYNGSQASALRHFVPLTSSLPGTQGGEEGEVKGDRAGAVIGRN